MKRPTPERVAYTLSEAARALGISPTQASRLIDSGKLRETKLVAGSGRYVTAASVDAYEADREVVKR